MRPKDNGVGIRSDAQYLVTGGFGAFGLATARWLVDNGARHLTLVGRTGAGSADARDQIAAFQRMGVSVTQEAVDVTDFAAVTGLVSRTHHSDIPLRGVYHAAGVVDDTAIPAITAETLTKVFAPKADGAVNLDRALGEAGIGLDHFVLYSSMSALMGGYTQLTVLGGQRHVAGGAFNRRRRGERALCVDWGAMGGGGMAEATDEAARFLSALGFTPINMDVAAEMLGECLRLDLTHVALMDIDWGAAFTASRAVAHSPRFAEHAAAAKAGAAVSRRYAPTSWHCHPSSAARSSVICSPSSWPS